MEKLILFHGTPDRIVMPTFGKGEEKHDYGQGLYLSESIDLAKEWAVWRANASYFYIAKEFVRDNIDMDILEELLSLGGLGIQYCIKTERAYSGLHKVFWRKTPRILLRLTCKAELGKTLTKRKPMSIR